MALEKESIANFDLAIVVPAYNAGPYLVRLYQAVVKQRVPKDMRTALIVVDDGSTDNTAEILANINQRDDVDIYCVRHEINQGRSCACNSGLDLAVDATYGMLMDADCELSDPYSIAAALHHLAAGVDVVIGRLEPSPTAREFWRRYQGEVFNRRLASKSPLDENSSALVAFRSSALRDIRFFTGYSHYGFEDRDFFISLKKRPNMSYIVEPRFSAFTASDSLLSAMAGKLWLCGRYSSTVFMQRHSDFYRNSKYCRFDKFYISSVRSMMLGFFSKVRVYLEAMADNWLLDSVWLPYFMKRSVAQLVLGLSYFSGTCERERERVRGRG